MLRFSTVWAKNIDCDNNQYNLKHESVVNLSSSLDHHYSNLNLCDQFKPKLS